MPKWKAACCARLCANDSGRLVVCGVGRIVAVRCCAEGGAQVAAHERDYEVYLRAKWRHAVALVRLRASRHALGVLRGGLGEFGGFVAADEPMRALLPNHA